MNYIVLIFHSVHRTFLAEKVLLDKGIKLDIIPTPKEITSDCGMAIRINPSLTDQNMVISLLNNNKINFNLYEKWMK